MRSIARVNGCRPPRPPLRPGRVTSMASPARRASSAASSSATLRAASAAPMVSRTLLIASPAALRWSPGRAPSDLSCAVMLPDLPSSDTRSASSASGDPAAAMSASACRPSSSIPDMPIPQKTKRGRTRALPRCVYHVTLGAAIAAHGSTLRRESAFRLFGQRRKTLRVVHGNVRQHLAIQGDAGLHQAVDEAAVAHAVDAGRGIDARDPQGAELALLLLAADVGVLQRLRDRLLGDAEDLATGVVVAL